MDAVISTDFILNVIKEAFTLEIILFAALGVFIGVTVGAIPGIAGDIAIALLLPFIYNLHPVPALGMLLGIYKGSMFGGAISAITFGVPGTGGAVVTVEDGYPAKKNGYPKKALLTALYSSVTGDTISTLILIFLALPLAMVALRFGPREYFSLYFFAILIISLLLQGGIKKGIVTASIGLLLGCIGMDPISGTTRLTFGIGLLRGGIPLIPLLIGVFAVSELMTQFIKTWSHNRNLSSRSSESDSKHPKESPYDPSKDIMTFKVYLSTLKATLIGSAIGTFIGALPGAGSSLAAFVSYGMAKRFSSHPERFGQGSLEGVAAPEAGNSATVGSSLIPLITFGIPGSATAALIGAAFMLMGMQPGPLMIQDNMPLMYTFFVVILIASVFNLFISYFLIPCYAKIAMIKPIYIYPTVFVLAVLGTYASRNSVADIWLLLVAGLLGTILKKGGYPLGPLVLAYIIGPGAERSLRQALLIGRGDWISLLKSPIAIGFYVVSIISLVILVKYDKSRLDAND